jgi:hypothetical protein
VGIKTGTGMRLRLAGLTALLMLGTSCADESLRGATPTTAMTTFQSTADPLPKGKTNYQGETTERGVRPRPERGALAHRAVNLLGDAPPQPLGPSGAPRR